MIWLFIVIVFGYFVIRDIPLDNRDQYKQFVSYDNDEKSVLIHYFNCNTGIDMSLCFTFSDNTEYTC